MKRFTSKLGPTLGTVCFLAALALQGAPPALAQADVCPENTVRLIVPFPPGGPVDTAARLLSVHLQERLGRSVIVESKPGASGSIGTHHVTRQPPDGCTVLLAYDTHAVNPSLFRNLQFDTIKDLKSVMLVGTIANVIATHPSRPWTTFKELISDAAGKPEKITYSTGGTGTLAQLAMKLLEQQNGVQFHHVPYRGGAPAAQALLGGHVDLMVGSVLSLAPHVREKAVRALAQTGEKRSSLLPDIPTVQEITGQKIIAVSWIGVFLPAATPDPVVDRLHRELSAVLRIRDVVDRMVAIGVDVTASSPAELDAFVRKEVERWRDVIERNNIKPD